MKIKQQKQIKKFLINEFELNKALAIFDNESKILNDIISHTLNKTKNQMKTLKNTILPRIALYKALLNETNINAYDILRKYMLDVVGKKKNSSMKKMERVPFFYSIYKKIFIKIMKKTDLQESTTKDNKKSYEICITKCLWHTATVENNVPELCKLFCDVDNITFKELKKIGFSRTKTLGYGGDCCDFHFFKK